MLRKSGPWSDSVLALLRHYQAVGFTGAPQVVGCGFDQDGREMLTFLEGGSPHPHAWPDEALPAIGDLLRRAHKAGRDFVAPAPARWRSWFGRDLPGHLPVIGHCDTGPWNIVADATAPYALIDWEFAGPVDATWELAQTAWLNAQLHDDDLAERLNLPPAAARARQVRLLLDGYGLAQADRAGFVDKLVEVAVRAARAEAIQHAVTAASTKAINADGFPLLWAITWRARSAAWMLSNRSVLEYAIG